MIDSATTGAHGEYWVQPNDQLIKPYRLCLRAISSANHSSGKVFTCFGHVSDYFVHAVFMFFSHSHFICPSLVPFLFLYLISPTPPCLFYLLTTLLSLSLLLTCHSLSLSLSLSLVQSHPPQGRPPPSPAPSKPHSTTTSLSIRKTHSPRVIIDVWGYDRYYNIVTERNYFKGIRFFTCKPKFGEFVTGCSWSGEPREQI